MTFLLRTKFSFNGTFPWTSKENTEFQGLLTFKSQLINSNMQDKHAYFYW